MSNPVVTRHGEFTRRQALGAASAAAVLAVLMPRITVADEAAVADAIKKLYGGKAMSDGRIKLEVPPIAENGLVVPVNIEVESPMTDADHVKAVHLFADGNPSPNVVSYRFTPASGKAAAATRMRLAQTQNVICVAEMSNGALFTATANIKVTIGGCGG
jgi:sulfur-oxidizing protein SoxY